MSRGTAYYDLPNGERIELPTTMPDVEEVPGPLCDGKFELPEAVKEMFKWMDETFGTWESDFSSFKIWMKLRKNFNPPVRWEAMQDKRRNPKPLGRNTYLYKARKIKSLARSTHTRVSLHKGKQKGTEEQCKHTFKIDDKLMLCITQHPGVLERPAHWEGGAKQSFDQGMYKADLLLFVKQKDYGPMPKSGKQITLDKKRIYNIKSCSLKAGMYRMELERVR